jgi:hypothetical protein
MPRDSNLFKECNEKIEELVLSLTLPLYFALSGLKTDVTQINTAGQGAMVVLVCVIATAGKVCYCCRCSAISFDKWMDRSFYAASEDTFNPCISNIPFPPSLSNSMLEWVSQHTSEE